MRVYYTVWEDCAHFLFVILTCVCRAYIVNIAFGHIDALFCCFYLDFHLLIFIIVLYSEFVLFCLDNSSKAIGR